ncbi:Uncharacterized protein HZ326_31629, partial [Fusarium oxysporum f. sp. albedinis]
MLNITRASSPPNAHFPVSRSSSSASHITLLPTSSD